MAALGGIWKKFLDLLPSTPRQVGTVVSVGTAGRYNVQLVGGGTITVRGEDGYQSGDRVFVAGDRIESKASTLPPVTIDV